MSNVIKCYDVVLELVELATDRFGWPWKLNEEKLNILHQYCEAFDHILKESNGEVIEVDIDEDDMTIKITIGCSILIIENETRVFYDLAERAISLFIEAADDFDGVYANFVFPSVWDISK